MISIQEDLINEYAEYKKVNGERFNWWSYVNMKSDVQTALGFVKLFYPDIVEVEGYFIIKDRFNQRVFNQWKEREKNKSVVEKMVNLYEVKDFFHINTNENENLEKQLLVFGEALKHFWKQSFVERFPTRNIQVALFEEYGDLFITVYTIE